MGNVFGFLWLALGALALWRVVRAARECRALIHQLRLSWWRTQRRAVVLGIAFATACTVLPYAVSSKAKLVGFPFPGAGFEQRDGM